MFFGCFVCFVEILQNTRKTPQNTRKTPQNTRKTPQNTTKHHKTHLLTKQPEFAIKPALALDFDEWLRLGSYDELTTLLAQARPSDDTCSTHRVGRARSDNGTWNSENGYAYCLFRPRAPAGTAESDKWMCGTGQGAHSPYRCQCFIRFLAEGGGPDTPDKHRPYLQGILLKRFDKH